MSTYIKPNGNEIEINENSVPYAISIGWKLKGSEVNTVEIEESNLEFLRRKYQEVTGKKPHHKLGEAALLKAIENGK
jgi:hypothetical protein